jgi:hypothetical protein
MTLRQLLGLRPLPPSDQAEQQLWTECSRLIANGVIYYNPVL